MGSARAWLDGTPHLQRQAPPGGDVLPRVHAGLAAMGHACAPAAVRPAADRSAVARLVVRPRNILECRASKMASGGARPTPHDR